MFLIEMTMNVATVCTLESAFPTKVYLAATAGQSLCFLNWCAASGAPLSVVLSNPQIKKTVLRSGVLTELIFFARQATVSFLATG
jgi:hypothetical protein